MRRQLALLSLAVASLVVVAFLVPVGILIRNQAQTRALSGAERDAQSVAAALAVAASAAPNGVITADFGEALLARFGEPDGLSIIFFDGAVVGDSFDPSPNVDQARLGAAFTASADGGAEVLVPVLLPDTPDPAGTVVVRAFVPDSELSDGVVLAWVMLFALGIAIILIAMFAADWLGRSVVRPVSALSEAAHRLGEGQLETRVQPAGPEEIAEVGEAFNSLAGRLDALLAAERESVADLSHRLRTPLTALRLQVETMADSEESMALRADIDELERAIDALIRSARSRSAETAGDEEVDLGAVVAHRAEFWQVLADEQGRATSVRIAEGTFPVSLARTDLGAMVDVLIENVFAHTPPGCGYRLAVRRQSDGCPVLIVSDDGPGFADLGVARRGSSRAGSTGLGLDIVVRTAERTGGGVRIGSSRDGGAEVTVVFGGAVDAARENPRAIEARR
jgi:signal transduction histidine kinase